MEDLDAPSVVEVANELIRGSVQRVDGVFLRLVVLREEGFLRQAGAGVTRGHVDPDFHSRVWFDRHVHTEELAYEVRKCFELHLMGNSVKLNTVSTAQGILFSIVLLQLFELGFRLVEPIRIHDMVFPIVLERRFNIRIVSVKLQTFQPLGTRLFELDPEGVLEDLTSVCFTTTKLILSRSFECLFAEGL